MTNTTSKLRAWAVLGVFLVTVPAVFACFLVLTDNAWANISFLDPACRHNFVDSATSSPPNAGGFAGAGVCAACHTPHFADSTASRLYTRPPGVNPSSPGNLCMDCHDGSMPTAGEWALFTMGGATIPDPGLHGNMGDPCTAACHLHENCFSVIDPNSSPVCARKCCVCHAPVADAPAAAPKVCQQWDIDDASCGMNDNNILSQHQVDIPPLNSTKEVECHFCHGPGHPTDNCILMFPDTFVDTAHPATPTPYTADATDGYTCLPRNGTPLDDALFNTLPDYKQIPRTQESLGAYCRSCHDGVVYAQPPQYPAPQQFDQFTGVLPIQQVGPSERGNPAVQQPGPTWFVPAQPPKDVNVLNNPGCWQDSTAAGRFTNINPVQAGDCMGFDPADYAPGAAEVEFIDDYFFYYEYNGHGALQDMNGIDMNVSCWNNDGSNSCHGGVSDGLGPSVDGLPHGSYNRYLVDDLVFGAGIDTVQEFATNLCYGCHVEVNLGVMGGTSSDPNGNFFHGWSDLHPGTPTHTKVSPDTGMTIWEETIESGSTWDVNASIISPWVEYFDNDPSTYSPDGIWPDNYFSGVNDASGNVGGGGILPLYADKSALIENRSYYLDLNVTTAAADNWIMCVTCHDPHGTNPSHNFRTREIISQGPKTTEGMLRKFPITWTFVPDSAEGGIVDPFCGECHNRLMPEY